MTTYYAICNVNGPISVRIEAASDSEAREAFEAMDHQAAIDEPRTDAEDDLDIDASGMEEADFDAALMTAGYTTVCDLSPIVNANAGTVSHLDGGWWLWREKQAEELAAPEITDDDKRTLGSLATKDDAGRHFTQTHDHEWLDRMEDAGIITIDRPVHEATGIAYSQEYWSVQVAAEVADWFDGDGNLIG